MFSEVPSVSSASVWCVYLPKSSQPTHVELPIHCTRWGGAGLAVHGRPISHCIGSCPKASNGRAHLKKQLAVVAAVQQQAKGRGKVLDAVFVVFAHNDLTSSEPVGERRLGAGELFMEVGYREALLRP